KPVIDDWENLSIEEYVHRCTEDVEINFLLWKEQWSYLVDLYGNDKEANRLIVYLSFKLNCAAEQEEGSWSFDKDRCESLVKSLESERDNKISDLKKSMPAKVIKDVKQKPSKPFKKNGDLSVAGEKWYEFCKAHNKDPTSTKEIEYIKAYEEPNPNSSQQLKEWLFSLGWKPKTYSYVRDKNTNDVRKIPQVLDGKHVCKSVLALQDKASGIKSLDGLSIINHRLGILKGFLRDCFEKDGVWRIKAEIGGLTNTLRFKHRVLVNLPTPGKPYGEDIRGCLISDTHTRLCGSDMSGLE